MTDGTRFFRAFAADRSGATAVEYALIAGLIFVTILGALTALGGGAGGLFQTTETEVVGAINTATGNGGGEEDD